MERKAGVKDFWLMKRKSRDLKQHNNLLHSGFSFTAYSRPDAALVRVLHYHVCNKFNSKGTSGESKSVQSREVYSMQGAKINPAA